MVKSNSSLCIGDCKINDKNIEIKSSLGGKKNKEFNYVQIRINHKVDIYLLTAYYIDNSNIENYGELFIFKIYKNDMINLILQYGGYAHGTKSILGEITKDELYNTVNVKEYAIRPKYGNECWKSLLHFRVYEITI